MSGINFEYIYHSCFVVEVLDYILIFDYYKDREKNYLKEKFIENRDKLNLNKKTVVFSSHSHSDHFNSEILDWDKNKENIFYVLSRDIAEKIQDNNGVKKKENIYFMEKNQELNLDKSLKIYTFGSTDLGVSFLVKIEENLIFHGGDLNWWNWGDEDTAEEAAEMERDYKNIVKEIKEVGDRIGKIDLVFFPVDPRLGKHEKDGVEYFEKLLSPKKIVPMHYE